MSAVLLETLKDGVLTLTMNRPDRLNALNPEMLARLHDALVQAAANRDVAVHRARRRGPRLLRRRRRQGDGRGRPQRHVSTSAPQGLRQRMEAARLLHEIPKPTIAMLRGAAAGAGLSLALACDLRIASETARLTTAFAKVALSGRFRRQLFPDPARRHRRRRASFTSRRRSSMQRRRRRSAW